jgi:hypothetical protein
MQKVVNHRFAFFALLCIAPWRRLRDSNPRYPLEVYTLSRRAPSTTRTSLLLKAANVHLVTIARTGS